MNQLIFFAHRLALSAAGTAADAALEPTATPTLIPDGTNIVEELKNVDPSKLAQMWSDFWPNFLQKCVGFLISAVLALIIFFIGRKLIRVTLRVVNRACERGKMEISVARFLSSVINVLLYVLLLTVIAGILGIQTTSFVALLGSLGLTIGLALQGSLSNFAGGVLILVLHPFRIGDYIIANGNEGTVTAIDIFYTKILTIDNKMIVLPNGTLANTDITNVTNEEFRRLDLVIPIGYSDDIKSVKEELYRIVVRNDKIMQERPIDLFVANFGDDAVEITLRAWVKTEEFLMTKGELLESIKYMFDEKGFTIPFHQLDVNVISPK